jgi:L-alanine-DL-glutamate epimerase-like enolase superfamily enzyme
MATEADARRAIPHLERLNVNAIEQPLRRGDFRGCARLRQRTWIPIMLDESIFTAQDGLAAIREEACDLISIYPGKMVEFYVRSKSPRWRPRQGCSVRSPAIWKWI